LPDVCVCPGSRNPITYCTTWIAHENNAGLGAFFVAMLVASLFSISVVFFDWGVILRARFRGFKFIDLARLWLLVLNFGERVINVFADYFLSAHRYMLRCSSHGVRRSIFRSNARPDARCAHLHDALHANLYYSQHLFFVVISIAPRDRD
jgi:hypothetical protein